MSPTRVLIVAQSAPAVEPPRLNSPHGPRPWLPATNRPTRLGRMAGFDVGDGTTGGERP